MKRALKVAGALVALGVWSFAMMVAGWHQNERQLDSRMYQQGFVEGIKQCELRRR